MKHSASSSSSPMSNAFSLPSAGGVVSLLNDQATNTSSAHETLKPLATSGKDKSDMSHRSNSFLKLNGNAFVKGSSTSSSASSSNTPTPSPFDSHPSGSGGESYTSSATSSFPPSHESSLDGNSDVQRKQVDSRVLSEESEDGIAVANQHGGRQNDRRLRTDTVSTSSQSDDGDELVVGEQTSTDVGVKRRRLSDSRADETVQSRGESMRKMLDHQRLARSPSTMRSHLQLTDVGKDEPNANHAQARNARDRNEGDEQVPMNMHRATARSHGGFYGRNELDKDNEEDVVSNDKAHESAVTSSSVGRKASNPSQIINGKKRYPCSYPGCDKTFSTSGHAARHNRIHTGSKPYRCTFPGCNASFSRQDNSLQHYRTHVLHPKSRSGGSINLDGSQMDPIALESELSSLDPETVATVQMGRKALEEGTAIAVVQEFIDGNGRRAEAVQRMVGQPKSGRRGSTATQDSLQPNWDEQSMKRRRMSLENSYGHPSMHDWYHPGAAPAPHQMHPSYASEYHTNPHPPPPHAYMHHGSPPSRPSHYGTYGPPPSYAPAYGPPQHHAASYPVSQQPPSRHEQPHPAFAPQHHPTKEGYHAVSAEHLNGSHSGQMNPAHPGRSEYAHADHIHPSHRYSNGDEAHLASHAYNDQRVRRSSDLAASSSYYSGYRHPASASLPPTNVVQHSPSNPYNEQSRYPPSDAMSAGHRRSSSAVQGVGYAGHHDYSRASAPYASSRTSPGPFAAPARGSKGEFEREVTSPSFSVRSFRSEGRYDPRGERENGALSLLSDAAVQNDRQDRYYNKDAIRRRARTSTGDGHFTSHASPPAALSKVPFSSDRSTNVLTPTSTIPPSGGGGSADLDGGFMRHQSTASIVGGGRDLPPIRNAASSIGSRF